MAGEGERDPYRYFRIEARELVDALAAGVTDLGRDDGTGTAAGVAALLRSAHTLKGAARVVSQGAIADAAHALEDLLGPLRDSTEPVPAVEVDRMLTLVDGAVAMVDAIVPSPPPSPAGRPPAESPVPGPREARDDLEPVSMTSQQGQAPVTVRADLADVDAVIHGVNLAMGQISVLEGCIARISSLRAHPSVSGELELALASLNRLLAGAGERMDRELRSVHDTVQRLRLMPLTAIVPDLERAVRDVAAAQGKRVTMDVSGEQVRLDAPMMAVVAGALRQIVRNAVAHGIELPQERVEAGKSAVGRLRLEVALRGSEVCFRCIDDGAGIDLVAVRKALQAKGIHEAVGAGQDELLDLLLVGGVSTAAAVTELSGRGIGLDVVRDAVRQVGGQVRIRTTPGGGTTIDLTTPLSLTSQVLVLVDVGTTVGLPLRCVREVVRVRADEIITGPHGTSCQYQGELLPFVLLATCLSDRPPPAQEAWSVLIVDAPGGTAAVGVSRVLGTAEPAVRPLPSLLPAVDLVAGAWLDVDGTPRLVLDPEGVVDSAGRAVVPPAPAQRIAPVLVVDDSLTTRMLEQGILEAAGYQVDLASSAEEGLAKAARNVYSVALVDVEMPGMDGFGFVAQVRSRPELSYLPCILVTSRASPDDRRRGRAAGASGHIDKGEFHQGSLLDTITRLAIR